MNRNYRKQLRVQAQLASDILPGTACFHTRTNKFKKFGVKFSFGRSASRLRALGSRSN